MLGRNDALYEFGSTRIDPQSRTIRRDGQNVPLSSRAFDMLLLLLERRGDLVPKEELLAKIWADTHVEESNLPVMISAIRRAIGDDGRQQKYIQTVSKSGYRFISDIKETRVPEPAAPEVSEPALSHLAVSYPANLPLLPKPRYARSPFATALAVVGIAALFVAGGGSFMESRRKAAASKAVSDERFSAIARAEMWSQKGRYAWNLQTKAGILQSVEYYRKAIGEDSGYAPGYAGLAESYVLLPSYSEGPGNDEFSRARAAAIKAISLDDNLADAHIGLGMVYLIVDRDFARSTQEFRKATALDPRSSLAEGELALCLIAVGETDEAVAHARQAAALDSLSIRAATDLGIVLYYGHRFMEAETQLEEVLTLNPYSYRTRVNLGKTYLQLGRFDKARQVLEEASGLSNHDPLADGLMAEAKGSDGDMEGAKSILASLEQRARTSYVAPVSLAFALVGLGRSDDALPYLRQASANRSVAALFLKVEPAWDDLHDNPDFSDLTEDIPSPTKE